jgi:hypothetical protein
VRAADEARKEGRTTAAIGAVVDENGIDAAPDDLLQTLSPLVVRRGRRHWICMACDAD